MTSLVGIMAGLLASAEAHVPAGTLVFDGAPDTLPALPSSYVVLGAALSEPTGTSQPPEFFLGGDFSMQESYDILCYAHAETGDTNITECRNAVWTAVQAVRSAVQVDRQLSGACTGGDWIVPGSWDYVQTSDEDLNDPDSTSRYAHIDFRFTVTTLIIP